MLNSFYILRTRWQEVLLIVGLQAAGSFAFIETTQNGSEKSQQSGLLFLAALLFVVFAVVAKMLALGFARTSWTDGALRYEPWPLLKIGRHYFWRIVGLELFIGLITASLVVGLYMLFMVSAANPESIAKERINEIVLYCAAASLILVAKPMLFGPAAILVTDCGVFGAFGWLSWLRLFDAKKLFALYVLWIAVALAPSFIAQIGQSRFIENYFVIAAFAIITGILTLTIYVTATAVVGAVYVKSRHAADGFGEDPIPENPENHGDAN